MKEGPDVSIVAALIGDPARANMLTALMSGLALSGTELAAEAGVTLSTASGHLSKLESAGLVAASKQGRTRYFRFADPDVAAAVDALIPIATRVGHLRSRPGRATRRCARHGRAIPSRGRLAVALLDRRPARRVLSQSGIP
jgi:DNA-binding transcriptional ArsR family regulator